MWSVKRVAEAQEIQPILFMWSVKRVAEAQEIKTLQTSRTYWKYSVNQNGHEISFCSNWALFKQYKSCDDCSLAYCNWSSLSSLVSSGNRSLRWMLICSTWILSSADSTAIVVHAGECSSAVAWRLYLELIQQSIGLSFAVAWRLSLQPIPRPGVS